MDDQERIDEARRHVRNQARSRMGELRLNQVQLADRAGVAVRTINRFFNSDRGWHEPAFLRALAAALEWPPDELDRRVEEVVARGELHMLESRVPGLVILQLGADTLAGLTEEEQREIRATLQAVALQAVGAIRARTPGRGFPVMNTGPFAAVGA